MIFASSSSSSSSSCIIPAARRVLRRHIHHHHHNHHRRRRDKANNNVTKATRKRGDGVKNDDANDDDDEEKEEVVVVSGLSRDPCDSFECTGTSPAVERCLRQVARDIRDGKDATRSVFPYATQARFSDGARAFTGAEKFERSACEMKRIFEGQGGFKNTVESIEVVPGGSEAKIVWRIRSTDGKTEVKVETTLDVNLITGKILSQDDRWSFVKGGESIELKRKALAVPDNVGNAMDEIMRTVDDATRAARELANSNGGEDEFGVDPNDPMKFFSYENNRNRNLSEFALLMALLFLISKMYEQVALLK